MGRYQSNQAKQFKRHASGTVEFPLARGFHVCILPIVGPARIEQGTFAENAIDEPAFFQHEHLLLKRLIFVFGNWHSGWNRTPFYRSCLERKRQRRLRFVRLRAIDCKREKPPGGRLCLRCFQINVNPADVWADIAIRPSWPYVDIHIVIKLCQEPH